MNKLETHRIEFWKNGFTVLDGLFNDSTVEGWRTEALETAKNTNQPGVKLLKKKFTEPNLECLDGVGTYDLVRIDGSEILKSERFKGMADFYAMMPFILNAITGLDVVVSPWPESSISVMVYAPPSGQMLPHYDSNGITLLLYLTDNEDGATKVLPLTALRSLNPDVPLQKIGDESLILPKTGRVVVMQGRKVWHTSEPVTKAIKVSSAWNYYERGDTWRPDGVDERFYK